MRHRKSTVKLNRNSSHRKAMFRNMVTSLFKHDRIQTTDVKAKALRSWADHLVTLAKRGDLHARRQALSIVREKDVVHKLFEEANERYGSIPGGYTRIVKVGHRRGDAALMSIIELVKPAKETKKKPSKKKSKPTPDSVKPAAPAPEETAAEAREAPETKTAEAVETVEEQAPADDTDKAEVKDPMEAAPQAVETEALDDESGEVEEKPEEPKE
jgi:large subunit ribosomal protein L17